jgi:glycosyltransferase involved in cell wall biosynthesis
MKNRVLVIGALPPPVGGMETVTEHMSNLKLKDYDMEIFNVAKNKIIKSNIIFNLINFAYRCIKLMAVSIIKNPDIMHFHITVNRDFLQKSILIKISKLLNKKIIIHIHGGAFKEFYRNSSKNKKENIKRTLNSADLLIVLSEGWKNYFKKLCPGQIIHVIPNCVDSNTISRYNLKYKEKNRKIFNILFVGRIERQKGIYELLKAFSQIKNQNSYLYIMGSFVNNEKEINQLTIKLGISQRVIFLGMINGNERFKYFAQADLFVLPSYWEGLPLTILEAMAFGLPIVSTKVGAIPEVVKKENGILVNPRDTLSIKEALLHFEKNNRELITISRNNKLLIKNKYTIKIFAKNIQKAYDEMI